MKKIIFFLFLLLISCTKTTAYVKINDVIVPVEIAKTREEKTKGLMFREKLEGGMLFVFNTTKPLSFWMKNTKIPLDIIFISENLKIVDFKKNFQPCSKDNCEIYKSYPAMYALEVNAGFIEENNITFNDPVQLFLD